MLTRPARFALRVATRRSFSHSAAANGLAPRRAKGVQQVTRATENARRGQATSSAAVQPRSAPSPAFNQVSTGPEAQPLQHVRPSELDDTFIGMSGGQIFHEMMIRMGVKAIYGYSGGAILPVYDAIYNSPHFEFILPRHEQGAGHMAEGYARATGKPGVVLVTSGPGATNVVTPMQDALMDGTPLVVFTGQVPTSAIGSDAFQEADILGISRACTKWNVMVKNVAEMPRRIKEAFEIATSGRPGPVLVDLPKDVTAGILRQPIPISGTLPTHISTTTAAAREFSARQVNDTITRVAKLINIAKKPVVYAGAGMNTLEGSKLLKELSAKACIPVTTTLQGLGAFDELDPLSLHMLGMHGSAYANLAMQEADLIIALGARFDDRVTGAVHKFCPNAKKAAAAGVGGIVHFEILPKNINKIVQSTLAVEGDVVSNVATLLPQVNSVPSRPEWTAQIQDWKDRLPFDYERETSNEDLIKPQSVISKLSDLTADRKNETIITTGVGQHQMWTAQFYRWRHPRSMITSGGLGTMGYGLPAAIGAQIGSPKSLVIDIDGDASLQMTAMELGTASQFNIPVKVIVLVNNEQGMVTQWQNLFYEDRYAHTHQANCSFTKLADSMNVQARRCVKPDDLEASLEWLIDSNGPALLEVVTDKKIPVLPMVPAGCGLSEFIVYDAEKDKERKALGKKRAPQYYT